MKKELLLGDMLNLVEEMKTVEEKPKEERGVSRDEAFEMLRPGIQEMLAKGYKANEIAQFIRDNMEGKGTSFDLKALKKFCNEVAQSFTEKKTGTKTGGKKAAASNKKKAVSVSASRGDTAGGRSGSADTDDTVNSSDETRTE